MTSISCCVLRLAGRPMSPLLNVMALLWFLSRVPLHCLYHLSGAQFSFRSDWFHSAQAAGEMQGAM